MRKPIVLLSTTLIVAFALGFGYAFMFTPQAQAKPFICRLAVEPFTYCVDRGCPPGQLKCYECLGTEPSGEPCLCSLIGCVEQ